MKVKTKIKALAVIFALSVLVFAFGFTVSPKTYAETVEGSVVASVYAEGETTPAEGETPATSSSVTSSSANGASSGCAGGWTSYVLIGVVAVALIIGAWWRSKKSKEQREEQQKKLDSLAIGTEVVTNALIKGKITKNEGDYVVIVTGDGENKSYLEIHKNAIYMILSEEKTAMADSTEEVAGEEVKEENAEENKEVFSDFDAKEEKESVEAEKQPTETEEKASESDKAEEE